jgi:SAM-dependent methyltransferase
MNFPEHENNGMAPERWNVAPPEVEALEAEWWQRFSSLEDEYAWVHPPDVRHTLRRRYIQQIISSIPNNGIIIDFGCGPGWFAILLAQLGARRVIGVDNAPAQIEIAKKKATDANQSEKITFLDSITPETFRTADAVIIHGVLHHLSWSEIDGLSAMLRENMLPTSKIFFLEPVEGSYRYLPWSLPYHIVRLFAKLRKQGPKEVSVRKLLESRGEGPRYPGFGVAPKEMPFRVGELEKRLSSRLQVRPGRPVLFFSVRLVMELLLLGETYPLLARILLRYGLPVYMVWERLSFAFAPKSLWKGWVFCLFEAKPLPLSTKT